MIEYVFMQGVEGDPVECDSCNYEAPLHKFQVNSRDVRSPLKQETRLYCKLCAGSFASTASQYSEQYPDHNAMVTACHVGNAILQQLGAWSATPIETLPSESDDESDFR